MLDNMGNRTHEQRFDPLNNVTKTQQREYDAQGNLKQITDPLLHTTVYQFDVRNRLKQITDAASGIAG